MTGKTMTVILCDGTRQQVRADGWNLPEGGGLALTDSTLRDPLVALFSPGWQAVCEDRSVPAASAP